MSFKKHFVKKNNYRSSTDKDSLDSAKHPCNDAASSDPHSGQKGSPQQPYDISAATFLDVSVMRCLFITHWQEEGIYWALHYLYNR